MPDHAEYLDPPFPIEVELFYKSMKRLNIQVGGAYIHNSTAYIYIMGFGRDLYAVVPCSPPPDPLGEADMTYNGVRMYSVGRFKQYIEWWKKYVYVLADIYIRDVSRYLECLERCMPRGDEVGYIWLPDYVKRECYNVFEIILDEELRSAGVKVVRPLYDSYISWVFERKSMKLVAVISPPRGDEVLSRWRERNMVKDRFREIIGGRIDSNIIRLTSEEASEIMKLRGDEDLLERVRSFIEEYCEGVYLVNEGFSSSISPSIRHPLNLLHLYRLARENGLDGEILKCRGRLYLGIVRGLFYHLGYWSLAVRPRRDLEIEYRYNARIEDGCLLIVDKDLG